MKRMIKVAVLAASLVAAASTARADIVPATLEVGGEFRHPFSWGYPLPYDTDYRISGLRGGVSLKPTDFWFGSFSLMAVDIVPAQGSSFNIDPSTYTVKVDTEVQSLNGTFDDQQRVFSVSSVGIAGGLSFNTSPLHADGKRNIASTGGSLQLTDFRIDLANQGIHARLQGGNAVGTIVDQLVWRFADLDVSIGDVFYTSTVSAAMAGLVLTEEARSLFAQALGLTAFGIASLSGVNDFGKMDLTFTAEMGHGYIEAPFAMFAIATPAVPEPSTSVMIGLGLIGLAYARRTALRPSSQH